MSNEYKDWLWDKFSDVLLEQGALDRVTHTEITNWYDWYAIVDGIKDGAPVKYNVWFDNEGGWNYELVETNT